MDINFRATILVVDSSSDNRMLIKEMLHARHELRLAASGAEALRMMQTAPRPDLVLLDATLPDMDGHTVFQELRADFLNAETPVIFLTLAGDTADERRALREGAADVITKPFMPETLQARVATQLQLRHARTLLKDQHSHLEYLIAERTREAMQLQDATILAMATLAETRDPATSQHLRRTQLFFTALARELRFNARFTAELSDANINVMAKAALLHDIGKVGVPDAILLKPGHLTPEEFEIMKRHTVAGREAILGVERTLGGSTPFLRYASEITWSHHERWDGSGYPQGLKGEAIPLAARLMAVADVYDALISRRVYKPAFTHETAVELIRQGRGEHFDPDLVDAMLVIQQKFRDIAIEFRDPD